MTVENEIIILYNSTDVAKQQSTLYRFIMRRLRREKEKAMTKLQKVLGFTYFSVCGMMLFSTYAFAYIDPGAMTYLVQIIAGVFIGGGAILGVYWNRLKRKVRGKDKEEDTRETVEVEDINDEI